MKNAADSPVTLRRQQADGESVGPVSGVALCRCGGSRNRPYCDGSHWNIGFSDESD